MYESKTIFIDFFLRQSLCVFKYENEQKKKDLPLFASVGYK
jgi:hypothetical protein